MIKKVFLIVLCSVLGVIFVFSGISKLYPIEPFEYTFVDIGLFNWQIAPFIARIFIGFELFVGILLFINFKKFSFKLGVLTLLFFCIYLVLLLLFSGNKGNCGCFGTYIYMTPLQALIKNVIMIIAFIILMKFYSGWSLSKKVNIIITLVIASSFIMPFILNPVELNYSEAYLNKKENNFKLELDSLYKYATLSKPPQTLSQDKHIIIFLSLRCKYCKIAANKIRIIHERNPKIPFYFVLNGDIEDLEPFFEKTSSQNIPHCLLLGKSFVYLAGTNMPVIYLVNNSIVENEVNYIDLDQGEIEKWLTQ
ncbi:MAG: DoxX family protein [Bacteroidia bacterium]|nr:DoxX family protein [Bacteroidia bacterium]